MMTHRTTAITDAFRRFLWPTLVVTIVGTLWAMGHAQAMADQAYNRRYWPALNPDLQRVLTHPVSDDEDADATARVVVEDL
jgi:hypothetical protein